MTRYGICSLYGIVTLQVVLYRGQYPDDHRYMRITVTVIWCVYCLCGPQWSGCVVYAYALSTGFLRRCTLRFVCTSFTSTLLLGSETQKWQEITLPGEVPLHLVFDSVRF